MIMEKQRLGQTPTATDRVQNFKQSRTVVTNDYLLLLSSLLQQKFELLTFAPVTLNIDLTEHNIRNLQLVKSAYYKTKQIFPILEIPFFIKNSTEQFTLSAEEDYILTIHLDKALSEKQVEEVIHLRKNTQSISYIYSEINNLFKIVIPASFYEQLMNNKTEVSQ